MASAAKHAASGPEQVSAANASKGYEKGYARHLLAAFGRIHGMPSCFYILRLKSGVLYPGATANLKQRWRDHVAGTACRTTSHDPPMSLAYREKFPTFAEARRREAQIKRWSRAKKEALVAGNLAALRRLAASRDRQC